MSGVITAGSAIWALVIALAVHIFISGRLGNLVPARLGDAVLPRAVNIWVLAGVAGLTVVTIGGWLHRATTAVAGWTLTHLHIPGSVQTVVGGLALLATLSVITAIVAGHAVSGRFVAECVLATALLAAIPGVAGQFLGGILRVLAGAGAFGVGLIV
jgi:hypothetical protein